MVPHRKAIPISERGLVVYLNCNGFSYQKIVEIVQGSHASVQTMIFNFKKRKSFESKPRSGCPLKLSDRDKRLITKSVKRNPGITSVEVAQDIALTAAINVHLVIALKKDDKNIDNGKSEKLFPIKADLRKEEEVTKAFQWVENNLGKINLLINNAGVGGLTNLVDSNPEEWKKMLDVNVVAFGLCIVEAVALMRKTKTRNGLIINITSNLAHFVPRYPPFHFYSATKHAANALVEGFRQEFLTLEIPIRITCISPGFVKTEIIRSSLGEDVDKFMYENYPSICPQDIASAIEYILSTPPNVTIKEIAIGPTGSEN